MNEHARTLLRRAVARPGVQAARGLIRLYQLTLSSVFGRHCRHLPTCSSYMDEAIDRHGLWAGGWMGTARLCRCHPFGTSGLDLVPDALPDGHRWYKPWSYGRWRGTYVPARVASEMTCEAAGGDGDGARVPPSNAVL